MSVRRQGTSYSMSPRMAVTLDLLCAGGPAKLSRITRRLRTDHRSALKTLHALMRRDLVRVLELEQHAGVELFFATEKGLRRLERYARRHDVGADLAEIEREARDRHKMRTAPIGGAVTQSNEEVASCQTLTTDGP